MGKPEWGTKRQCPSCAARFYDLMRADPIVCISCEHEFQPEVLLKPRRARPEEKPKAQESSDDEAEAKDADSDDEEFEVEGEDSEFEDVSLETLAESESQSDVDGDVGLAGSDDAVLEAGLPDTDDDLSIPLDGDEQEDDAATEPQQ